ncbi:MAG TPA: chromosomal replication initiator protein DnaA, partial [Corynebacterium kroppenstedtii]|nr:chromosomal replication initiator protein DnaA [Corynebacterium kroppenstedtii]
NYTFDNLVAGEGNRVVRAAAIAVAENPAQAYNPLFIWGGSGLGKTHILHAIGHRALELRPNLRVRYVSIEEYTNEWINSIRNNRGEDFKRKYRSFDILLVDDIQFLAGKPETQIEFFHNFNALHGAQKQIVLCSDRSPKELTELEPRLRTRFQWGFTQDIQKPDLETRIAILRLKAERENAQVPSEVLSFIAEQKAESVRELEGALNKVLIVSSIQHTPVTLEMARDQLQDLVAPEVVEITAPTIMSVTAEYFNLTTADLTGPGKARPIAHARQVAMYLCRELTDLSLPKVGNKFGGRDHTTAMYAERKIRKEMSEKRSTNEAIQEITARIKDQAR